MVGMFTLKDRHKATSLSLSPRQSYTKSTTSIDYTMLPKKIIKAISSYKAQQPHELDFEKGDFFHVVGRENDLYWYAVNNPLTNRTGLVPVSHFQVVDKNTRTMSLIQPTLPQKACHDQAREQEQAKETGISSKRASAQHCYGIVLYDFTAERTDELQCKANEAVIIIAQSNEEWYVAKPIGRLGGPGLIPVSFVQLHDVITDRLVVLPSTSNQSSSTTSSTSVSPRASITIPKLDEWKMQTQIYEASSILVAHQQPAYPQRHPQHKSPTSSHSSPSSIYGQHQHSRRRKSPPSLDPLPHRYSHEPKTTSNATHEAPTHILHSASSPSSSTHSTEKVIEVTVNSFILEGDQYLFVLYATVHSGKHRILYRTYECFYEFHVELLQDYPEEAGKGKRERILPYLPGPLETVDDNITEQRREDLDHYCKTLLVLPSYMSECKRVQNQLFGLRKGDVETDYAPKKGSKAAKSTITLSKEKSLISIEAPKCNSYTDMDYANPSVDHTNDDVCHGTRTTKVYYNGGVGKVKIKIVYKDDIFAVKMPADCTLQELQLRVKERLGGTLGKMKYKDDIHHTNGVCLPLETELDMEEAFILAIQRGKLTILVD